jgi:glycosyltransferase involved in cell wall biosynthesis
MMATCVRQLYRGVDGFLAVSDAVADEAAQFFRVRREAIATVYNPFDSAEIERQAARAPDIELPAEPFIVACGRLVKAKGFDDLIAAFAVVRRRRPLKLVILGEGPEGPALRECARAHGVEADVMLPGFVGNPFAVFSRSAAFVLSSRYGEAFSRVLVEAMACGVPVIASRCRWGPAEVLADGRYGRMFDVGDIDGLAAALEEVVATPGAAQSAVAAAQRRVRDFSVEEILPQLEQVYFGQQARPALAVPVRTRPRAASTPAGS